MDDLYQLAAAAVRRVVDLRVNMLRRDKLPLLGSSRRLAAAGSRGHPHGDHTPPGHLISVVRRMPR